jgi:hypothetical protein
MRSDIAAVGDSESLHLAQTASQHVVPPVHSTSRSASSLFRVPMHERLDTSHGSEPSPALPMCHTCCCYRQSVGTGSVTNALSMCCSADARATACISRPQRAAHMHHSCSCRCIQQQWPCCMEVGRATREHQLACISSGAACPLCLMPRMPGALARRVQTFLGEQCTPPCCHSDACVKPNRNSTVAVQIDAYATQLHTESRRGVTMVQPQGADSASESAKRSKNEQYQMPPASATCMQVCWGVLQTCKR